MINWLRRLFTRQEPASLEAEFATVLATVRGGRAETAPRDDRGCGLYRIRLQRNGVTTGWIRATPWMAQQAKEAELDIRPEEDFPLVQS